MRSCVVFFITGPSHLPNVAVAAHSLRKSGWTGPVFIYAWAESYAIAKEIGDDPRIDAEAILRTDEYRGKNAQEIAKISLIQDIRDFDVVVYLDADLLIMKPINPLIEAVEQSPTGFAATQFCNWKMSQGIPRRRVERLFKIPGIEAVHVNNAMNPDAFSYNSGIFATRPNSIVLPEWGDWTFRARGIFISGEAALHPIAQKHKIVTMPGSWNCSPNFKSKYLPDDQVCIWHFHGDCNTRPSKSPRGVALWFPEFQAAMTTNIGGLQNWVADIPNEFLYDLMVANNLTE